MKRLWNLLISLDVCLWLLAVSCCALATGSFQLRGEYAQAINTMPLFSWLREFPFAVSWWLWLTIALLCLLVLNTLCCSFDTIRSRWGKGGIASLLAPQVIHAGFLLIVLAHLISAIAGFTGSMEVAEGAVFPLPNGEMVGVARVSAIMSPKGMPLGYTCALVTDLKRPDRSVAIRPNHPWFHGGYGVYIKHAELYPQRWALLEIHREPGAGMALAGALLFTLGNVALLYFRSKRPDSQNSG